MAFNFKRNASCQACQLHTSCKAVCIPTSRASDPLGKDSLPVLTRSSKAVLILGEAPGLREDEDCLPFRGPSGVVLWQIYVKAMKLYEHADIFVSNSVRCRPPSNVKPTITHIKACRQHWQADAVHLLAQYGHDNLTILCVGATATRAALNSTLSAAFSAQGTTIPLTILGASDATTVQVPVFSTYHPAFILPGRSPSAISSVKDHLDLLIQHLSRAPSFTLRPEHEVLLFGSPYVPHINTDLVALDIETYGACAQYPHQKYFHPVKSMAHDGVPQKNLVLTAALSFRKPNHPAIFSISYDLTSKQHASNFYTTCSNFRAVGATFLGMNLVFDLLYLRAWRPEYRNLFDHHCTYADLAITSYLHNEARPERDLKSLATLVGGIPYQTPGLSSGHRYASSSNKHLHTYNRTDTYNTLYAHETLRQRTLEDYPKTGKHSAYCCQWYSDLIFDALVMSEWGVTLNTSALHKLASFSRQALKALLHKAVNLPAPWGGPVGGKNSELHISACMELIQQRITHDYKGPSLQRTDARGDISSNEENRNTALNVLPKSHPAARLLRTLHSYRYHQKLTSSYINPLLTGRGTDAADLSSRHVEGNVYPSWYIVPSKQEAESSPEGGTNQGRIVCKRPALQTAPPPIKKCLTSRFPGGSLLAVDLSQIELRVAALLSGDSSMMDEYRQGLDRHLLTAASIFYKAPDQITYRERQAGKTLNFLTLFRGGAQKFHDTLIKQVGLNLHPDSCIGALNTFRLRYPQLIKWQDDLIEEAERTGRITLPLTGQSRLFLGGPKAVRGTYLPTVVNFPVQCTAANVLISIQHSLIQHLRERKLSTVVGLQIYDALIIDCPPSELAHLSNLLPRFFNNPPYYRKLCEHLGRTVPLGYKATLLNRSTHEAASLPNSKGGQP